MIVLIVVACLISAIVYAYDKEITFGELLKLDLIVIVCVSICFGFTQIKFPNDTYFESGRFNKVEYHPYFVERYTQVHVQTYTCGKSTCTRTYTTIEYQKHPEEWVAYDTLGQNIKINKQSYKNLGRVFGNRENHVRDRSRYTHGGSLYKGDPSTYSYNNETNSYNYPTVNLARWYNPLKKTRSLFDTFSKDNKLDIPYPIMVDLQHNNRLLATTNFTQADLDILNTKLYETKQCNLIIINVDNMDISTQIKQQWNTGKYNDIIITYSGDYDNPTNVKVFGWYKSEILAKELETYIISNGIKKVDLNNIYDIVCKYYEPFDFTVFNYLLRPVEWWQILITAIITILAWMFGYNEFSTNYDRRY